ncbi:FYN-binding protein 1 isoform X1 [Alosa alosa]|uniref:FYN-binding protein 1 isoform X1 n=1 Tax=Alosa alosa TaxID=278164 RepID=UPI0020153B5D|nr:FYN-binding protein 1 isoform X1 [Alosa alosa]
MSEVDKDNKTDVRAIMARFNTGTSPGDSDGKPAPGSRPKVPVHPTVSSGPPINAKKPVLEGSLSGSAASSTTVPKPNFLKSTASTSSAPEMRESPRPKALASRFEAPQENTSAKPSFVKQFPPRPKPGDGFQDSEPKSPFHKQPLQKPPLGIAATTMVADHKPPTPKPPPAVTKPPWLKDTLKSEDSGATPSPPKLLLTQKPKSSLNQFRQQSEGSGPPKPLGVRAAQNMFNRGEAKVEDGGIGESAVGSKPKPPLTIQKPALTKKPSGPGGLLVSDDPSAPKRNPLPNIFALGSAPAKPNRPPNVNLDKFSNGMAVPMAEEIRPPAPVLKKSGPPPPPAAHPSSQATSSGPTPPALPPCLPPRPPGAITQPGSDDNYDDLGSMNPPPLPAGGHPGQRHEDSESEEEMYEDLDDKWVQMEKEQEKKKEKEDKKRIEQEKKEQKERERKESDARKKFKLTGPVQIIHKAKARVDCKGGKTELTLKQGESIDIIRIGDNPEGRWLARSQDGSYGYVRTDSVDIDFQSLKQIPGQMIDDDPEVYDDIGAQHDTGSGINGQGVILPPPPGEDGEIYDDLDDPSFISPDPQDVKSPPKRGFLQMFFRAPGHNTDVPPPPQFTPDVNADEEIYDDVDSQGFPPPPPISSLPKFKPKNEDKDPKKQKKLEKEEKDFRKKFKFEGDINTLYQVSILPSLSCKKWGGKDLPLTPGETLDVIIKAQDNKLVCRNSEGKFGYVSVSHIVVEDADIYDDIGDECIYDND